MAFPKLRGLEPGSLGSVLAPLILVLAGVRAGTSEGPVKRPGPSGWRAGSPVSIAVRNGRATFRVPSPAPGSECAVIVSALARSPGPFPLHLGAASADSPGEPETVALAPIRPSLFPAKRVMSPGEPSRRQPATARDFHVMVRDGDVTSPSNYLAVRGVLRAVGTRVQVYVAAEDVPRVDKSMLEDMVKTFDDRILPVAARTVGMAHDIDGDGRFTILVSSWLERLGSGRNAVDGFVRVTDLDPLYSAPFGNRCDMMYLSTSLKAGPHLRTIMAHEYMHAVVFSQKSLSPVGPSRTRIEEEGWLDEALAHLAEDLHGFSRSNIDYRVSTFLSQPERYQLVVEDYYAADLFRSHGHRGSTYLFLRWCVDQFGQDLLPALAGSKRKGLANLELATSCPFAELYRRWSVALFESGLQRPDSGVPDEFQGYRTVDMRTTLSDWQLAGPRTTRVDADGPADRWDAVGTSSHFAIVRSRSAGAVEVSVSGPPEAELQVTTIPLPPDMARLELTARTTCGPDGELRLRASVLEGGGGPVRLSALAWEPLTPPADRRQIESRHGGLDMLGIASSFGTSAVPAGGRLSSRPIHLRGVHEDTGTLVIKLIGTDAMGRKVAAWAEVNGRPPEPSAEGHEPLAKQGS
jgi:hypothetical protein